MSTFIPRGSTALSTKRHNFRLCAHGHARVATWSATAWARRDGPPRTTTGPRQASLPRTTARPRRGGPTHAATSILHVRPPGTTQLSRPRPTRSCSPPPTWGCIVLLRTAVWPVLVPSATVPSVAVTQLSCPWPSRSNLAAAIPDAPDPCHCRHQMNVSLERWRRAGCFRQKHNFVKF